MNKLKFTLAMTLMSFLFFSCTEDEESMNDTLLIGEWSVSHLEASTVSDYGSFQQEQHTSYENIDITAEFKSDKTWRHSGKTDIITTTVLGDEPITMTLTDQAVLSSGNWELNGDEIIMSDENGMPQAYNIESLTETELKVSTTAVQETEMNGTTITISVDARIEYTRN